MRFLSRWMIACPLLVLAMKPGGCGQGDDEELTSDLLALAADAGEANEAADQGSQLATLPTLALTSAAHLTSPETAATTATNAGIYFKPAGCITATRTGAVVTYVFAGCTGPFGFVKYNGKLVATFAASASGGIDIDVRSDGFKVNNSAVEQSAKAHLTITGSTRKLTWSGGFKGTTATGNLPFDHTANYTVGWDVAAGCVEVDGTGSTSLGTRGVETTTTAYRRCSGVCPASGTLTATGKTSGLSLTLKFLGGGRAQLTVPSGRTWDYTLLFCKAQ